MCEIETAETYEKGRPKRGGLSDPRMGTMDRAMKCETDGMGSTDTPGYFGHLELVKPVLLIRAPRVAASPGLPIFFRQHDAHPCENSAYAPAGLGAMIRHCVIKHCSRLARGYPGLPASEAAHRCSHLAAPCPYAIRHLTPCSNDEPHHTSPCIHAFSRIDHRTCHVAPTDTHVHFPQRLRGVRGPHSSVRLASSIEQFVVLRV